MSTTKDDHLDDLRERLFSRDHLGANNALFDAIELGVDAEPLVVELLEHVNVYRQPIVAAALGDARKPGPADEALRSLLSRSGPHTADVRCAALVSLAKRLGPDATEDFVGALRGPSAVRAYALTCLAAVGDDRGWEQVYGLLADVLRRPQESRRQPSASVTSAVLYLASRARRLSGRSDRLMSLIRSRWSHLGHEDQDWLREYWRGFDPAEPEARDVEPPADLLAKFAASPLFTGRAIRRHGPEIAPGAEVVPDPHEPRLVPMLGEASEAVPYELADFGMSQLDLVSLDAEEGALPRASSSRLLQLAQRGRRAPSRAGAVDLRTGGARCRWRCRRTARRAHAFSCALVSRSDGSLPWRLLGDARLSCQPSGRRRGEPSYARGGTTSVGSLRAVAHDDRSRRRIHRGSVHSSSSSRPQMDAQYRPRRTKRQVSNVLGLSAPPYQRSRGDPSGHTWPCGDMAGRGNPRSPRPARPPERLHVRRYLCLRDRPRSKPVAAAYPSL